MKKIILIFLIIIALIAFFIIKQKTFLSSHNNNIITLYGNIDTRHVELAFNNSERIKEIFPYEGDFIKKGDLLATLDSKSIELQIEQLKFQIEAQRELVNMLEKGSREEEIKIAKAEFESAKVQKENAQKTLARIEDLSKHNLISKQNLDDAISNYNLSMSRLKATEEKLRLVLNGPREEDKNAAKANLNAMYAKLELIKKALNDCYLYAPVDGIIEDRILEPGDMAFPNKPVFTIAITDPVWARVYIPENLLGKIKHGMDVQITTDSYPDKKYPGKISYISPNAEFTPKTVETPQLRTKLVYEMRVTAPNPHNELRLGMPVTVSINLNGNDTNSTRH